MQKNKDFIKSLNILDGTITYNDFDIDENLPFEDQWYMYKEDILQIEYGERFVLDVGWHSENDSKGNFHVVAILDKDWLNPVSKIKCRTLKELKKAIEKTAVIISKKRKIKDLPFRNVEYESFD